MKVIGPILAVMLALLGFIFLAGSQGMIIRLVIGVVLLCSAIALVAAARLKPRVEQRNIVQRIDLPGNVRAEQLTCRQCGAGLSKESMVVKAGGVLVDCRHCGSTYQLHEEPRW